MKPKDALIRDGFPGVKAGKGRLSLEAKERLKVLAAEGWNIDGYSVTKATEAKPATVVQTKPANGPKVIADIPDETRNESLWTAHVPGGKRIGMREVCVNCSQSFTYCPCPTPRFNLDYKTVVDVDFKPIREKR